jgi:hypothetical protein
MSIVFISKAEDYSKKIRNENRHRDPRWIVKLFEEPCDCSAFEIQKIEINNSEFVFSTIHFFGEKHDIISHEKGFNSTFVRILNNGKLDKIIEAKNNISCEIIKSIEYPDFENTWLTTYKFCYESVSEVDPG